MFSIILESTVTYTKNLATIFSTKPLKGLHCFRAKVLPGNLCECFEFTSFEYRLAVFFTFTERVFVWLEIDPAEKALMPANHFQGLSHYAHRNLGYVKEDSISRSYAYVTRDDLLSVFGEDVVFTIPSHDEDVRIGRTRRSLCICLDYGSTVDVRLVTVQGRCCTTLPETETARNFSRVETSSPTLSTSSSTHSTALTTLQQTTTKENLVNEGHTFFCNPETKKEMEALENKLTGRVVLQSSTVGHSLRRFIPDFLNTENPPLLPLHPRRLDYKLGEKHLQNVCKSMGGTEIENESMGAL
uniref:Uncharacterized protein n=1 Tax=Glossina morsitans morsitans TaxID=37546 RepID=A0A1B0FFK9_GLOMM